MDKIKIKFNHFKFILYRDFFNARTAVLAVVSIIVFIWIWNSILAMNKNYHLEKEIESKKREKLVQELKYETLVYEQNYLKSQEYQEIAAREKLGLAYKGENVLILPNYPEEETTEKTNTKEKASNLAQWINFLFGGNAKKI